MPDATPDPAREVLRDLDYIELIECAHRWRTERAEYCRLWNAAADRHEGAEAARDQALAERDALRAEVEKLRAAQATAPVASAAEDANLVAHTPGPWIVENTGDYLWIGPPRSDGSGKVDDVVVGIPISELSPNAHARATANACLIASAPDMLASLRAAPGCGEKVRALVELSLRWLNAYPQRSFWSSEHAREFYDLMRTFPKDADLAAPALPDHVRECVEACKAVADHFGHREPPGSNCFQRVYNASHAAKGGA